MAACSSGIAAPVMALSDTRSKSCIASRAEEVAELLAFHFGRSDEAEKAVDYAILAAEKAQRRWANNEALSYFSDALRRLDAMPDTEREPPAPSRCRAQTGRGKFALGRHAEHITALEDIRGLVEASRRSAAPSYLALLDRLLTQLDREPGRACDRALS